MSASGFDVAQLALLGEAAECLTDVAVFVWDEDRTYVAVNQQACTLIGKTREELLALKVGDLSENHASPLFEEVQRRGLHPGRLGHGAGGAYGRTHRALDHGGRSRAGRPRGPPEG